MLNMPQIAPEAFLPTQSRQRPDPLPYYFPSFGVGSSVNGHLSNRDSTLASCQKGSYSHINNG